MKGFYPVLFLLSLLTACTSAKKSFERNDFDVTIQVVAEKLYKKKKVKDEELQMFTDAYERALERDKTQIQQLKQGGQSGYWVDIFNIYSKMIKRQETVMRVAPVVFSNGSTYSPPVYNYEPAREEARERAAEHYYQWAANLLKTGVRSDAREAYKHLDCIFYYYKDYKDAAQLMKVARDMGTAHVLLTVDKNPQLFLPQNFEQELLNYDYNRAVNDWVAFYTNPTDRNKFDFGVKLILTESYMSPGTQKEKFYEDTREVEDGWQYVYDKKGNVMKDSSGNDIKVPKYTRLIARVTEVQMNRSAGVRGVVEFYDFNRKQVVKQENAQGESIFNHYYATFLGDKRALSDESLKKIQNLPMPFPTDMDMIITATNELKKQFWNIFAANVRIFNRD